VAYWDMETQATKGGPSGEFAFFADLIGALSCLGVQLTVVHSIKDFWTQLTRVDGVSKQYSIIITDYDGLGAAELIGDFPGNHCRYYIMDYFGTQDEFNQKARRLDLKRILTPYPFDGSNTPLYFAVDSLPRPQWADNRKEAGILWAKSDSYLLTQINSIQWAAEIMPLHTFMSNLISNLPAQQGGRSHLIKQGGSIYNTNSNSNSNTTTLGEVRRQQHQQEEEGTSLLEGFHSIDNLLASDRIRKHGFVDHQRFLRQMTGVRFVLGLGAPLDGPTALEALAHGCIFINPTINPPITIADKPTRRMFTSQHSFVEEYISWPHAITLDIQNKTALQDALVRKYSQDVLN
jgi:Glycosyltransferase family 18